MPRRPSPGLLAVLAALAALAGAGAAVLLATSPLYEHRGGWVAVTLLLGWGFSGAGLWWWYQRPGEPTGHVMGAIGAFALLSSLAGTDQPVLFGAGFLFTSLVLATATHLLLAFPTGRLSGTPERALVAAAYVLAVPLVVLTFPWLEPTDFADCRSCPRILNAVTDDQPLQEAAGLVAGVTGLVIGSAILLRMLRRRRLAGPQLRRGLDPVIATGALSSTLVGVGFLGVPLDLPGAQGTLVAGYASLALLPGAYLAGITRARLGEVRDLQLANRRLEDELHDRLIELQESRARLVRAGDEARRRLERDLHDGAQQRFVALALTLRLARGKVEEDGTAAELLDAAQSELATGLQELRELARGIHPAILTDRGLSAAVDHLAGGAPLPVDLELPDRRFAPDVEAAAYFVVAEALANVTRYAQATAVDVRIACVDGELVVVVADDGVGGADAEGGTGLRGLADRVSALGGRLAVDSPPGGGTRLEARLPTG